MLCITVPTDIIILAFPADISRKPASPACRSGQCYMSAYTTRRRELASPVTHTCRLMKRHNVVAPVWSVTAEQDIMVTVVSIFTICDNFSLILSKQVSHPIILQKCPMHYALQIFRHCWEIKRLTHSLTSNFIWILKHYHHHHHHLF